MKRFYKTATAGEVEGAPAILLDGRPVRTPGRRLLAVPNPALAAAVAAEWAGQAETIRPEAMPLTRLVNTVVDQLPAKRDDAVTEVMGYGAADLLCYRHASPADLGERQARLWQPWLDWAAEALAAPLVTTLTVEPIPQPEASLAALTKAAEALDDWQLVGLHAATRLTSSLILGFAMARGVLAARPAFASAFLEELYEIERWGLEEEQARRHAVLEAELQAVEVYFEALTHLTPSGN